MTALAKKDVDAALELFDRAERLLARNVPDGFRLLSSGVYLLAQLLQEGGKQRSNKQAHLWILFTTIRKSPCAELPGRRLG